LDEVKSVLVAYGLEKLASVTGGDAAELLSALGEIPTMKWQDYETLLGSGGDQEEALSCIFSWIALPDEKGQRTLPQTAYYVARPLELEREVLFPYRMAEEGGEKQLAKAGEAREASDLVRLWQGFKEEYRTLWERLDSDKAAFFEGFYHLYHKWAWAVPCTYGEPGVSLFQQWKAVAALVFATGEKWADGPGGKFTLIGGDIPGIQDFVYTITSKGAAKGLRGRSFFIQLLGDAVVRRILANLKLCPANVIYDAGGNFMVLASAGQNTQDVLGKVKTDVNQTLLDTYDGDIALCLAHVSMPAEAVGTAEFGAKYSLKLKRAIARQKARRFVEIANETDGWEKVFEPQETGGHRFCVVCHRDLNKGQGVRIEDEWWCEHCHGFVKLAQVIAKEELLLLVGETAPAKPAAWQRSLHKVSELWYVFGDKPAGASSGWGIYTVNRTDFLTKGAQGFRFLANTTPRISREDIEWFKGKYPDEEAPKREEVVKDFDLMGRQAVGLKQVGVLRMDVDSLGHIITRYLKPHTMTRSSALSNTLSVFFGGWLNEVCRQVEKGSGTMTREGSEKPTWRRLYIIYSGGDDLFIAGSWDLMPRLAERIHDDFAAYVGHNPHVRISAGITLEGRKFPLYRAAERAGEALDNEAKEYKRKVNGREREKDAICFLDTVVGWEDWELVRSQKDEILWLIGARDNPKEERRLPRALLQVIQSIHQLYRTGLRRARRRVRRENRQRPPDKKLPLPKPQMFFGRWAWMQAYSLVRMARRSKDDEVKVRIMGLQKQLMQPATVRYSGLAARWAEYLTRKEGKHG
jgi:CRISPR-associated protein Csm1